MRIVVDTCVWVAAVRSRRGASFALLSETPHKRFQFGISVPLFLEYRAKLTEAAVEGHTPLNQWQIEAILAGLARYGIEVPIYYRLRPNLNDENDNMVFECAANFDASAIVTHNVRDFTVPELAAYNIAVLPPGEFIQRIRSVR
jgi:putative PIN family toxin of toxin-antitoxin system